MLQSLIRDANLVLYSKHIVGKGIAFFEQARKRGLEGIVAKRRDSTYQERRSREWLKIKAHLEQEFVIGGWTDPTGSRIGFGSLLLGAYDGKKLQYAGNVGTGFSENVLRELHAKLKKLARKTSPFAQGDALRGAHYVEPKLVGTGALCRMDARRPGPSSGIPRSAHRQRCRGCRSRAPGVNG